MRKNFGVKNWLYPMPVLIVGSYSEDGVPNAMNAAWGGIYDTNLVMVCLADDHKTTENIKKSGAFTLSFIGLFCKIVSHRYSKRRRSQGTRIRI